MKNSARPGRACVATALSFVALSALTVFNAPAASGLAAIIFTPPEAPAKVAPVPDKFAPLEDHQVVVFIDSSHSMARSVAPDAHFVGSTIVPEGNLSKEYTSRWQWCCEQTDALGKQIKDTLKQQLKVVVFNSTFKVYENVDFANVPTFFVNNQPGGKTNATTALKSQLRGYFRARDAHQGAGAVKPLLIAIVTDGCPDDPFGLRQAIIDATKKMHKQDEVTITFLQVGVDPTASKYLHELDHDLVRGTAKFDIVSTKSFDDVNKSGLAVALLDAIKK